MLMSIAQEPIEAECATYYHRRRLGNWGDIMMDAPWWISLLISWLPFVALIVVWIILSRYMTKGRGPWGVMTHLYEAQVAEMRRMNALMERIAVALEKRAEAKNQ